MTWLQEDLVNASDCDTDSDDDGFGDEVEFGLDPDDHTPFTFLWDLDGDGNYGETGADAARGDETGATPTFDATGFSASSRPANAGGWSTRPATATKKRPKVAK